MLSAKPWKMDALARLFASVLICTLLVSAIAVSVLRFFEQGIHASSVAVLGLDGAALAFFIGALVVLNRSWRLENFVRNFAALLICVYGGFFLMWLATRAQGESAIHLESTTLKMVVAVISFQGAALVLAHFFLREHQIGWREAFGFNNGPGQALLLGVLVGLSAFPISGGLQMLSGMILDFFHIQSHEQEAVMVLRTSATWLHRLVMGIAAIVLAPVAEEILFRGILYPGIKNAGFPRLALWISAVLFGAIHGNAAIFLPLTVFALALAWVYERTDNLLSCITAHSLFNTANFVMLFAAESFSRLPGHK